MPRLQRRETSRRAGRFEFEKLNLSDVLALATGRTYGGRQTGLIRTIDDLRVAWEENRERFMWLDMSPGAGTAGGGYAPGKRPESWWRFDAPEGRLVIGCKNLFAKFDPDGSGEGHWVAGDGKRYDEAELESQREFLQRHGLLSADEIRLLDRNRNTKAVGVDG